jgi:hypothetical protein
MPQQTPSASVLLGSHALGPIPRAVATKTLFKENEDFVVFAPKVKNSGREGRGLEVNCLSGKQLKSVASARACGGCF